MRSFALLRRSWRWMLVGLAGALVVACLIYAVVGDSYVAAAVATAPPSEAKSFDLGSLSGLAELGSGGQRTNFEEFAFRIDSDANVRAVIATRQYDRALAEFAVPGGPERTLLGFEQGARALFGKAPKVIDPLDRLVAVTQKHITVKKTPEGYYAITLGGARPEGKAAFLAALIDHADRTVRDRAIADYRGRIATFQRLVDSEAHPAERAILITLIVREYTTYASAQSGRVFAFDYVETPDRVTRVYAPGLLIVVAAMIAVWAAACAAYLVARGALLRP